MEGEDIMEMNKQQSNKNVSPLTARLNQWEKRKSDLLLIGILAAFAWFVNSGIEIKGLYMDDLYLWSFFGEQSFLEYVFPIGGVRCRYVYYLAAWLQMAAVGNHVSWFIPINIIVNIMVAVTLYFMGKDLGKNRLAGFICGFCYLLSRMSYYQISQVWGLMETMALWLAIGILYLLYTYLNKHNSRHCFTWAAVLYFLVCFVHERYMVLFPVFILVLLLKKSRSLRDWLQPVISFGLVQIVRVIATGGISPAGTGGTEVADTFSLKEALKYAVSQVAYIFGINAGPQHLNGQNYKDSPGWVLVLILIADLALMALVFAFAAYLVRDKKHLRQHLSNITLFVVFIGGCIASSSVTIRLEMRWIYVSLTAALLLMAYMYGTLAGHREKPGLWLKTLPVTMMIIIYAAAMFPVEVYYRNEFPNLYYWPNQLRYNSLAEETYEKYGSEIFGKTIYIIGNEYEMSEFTGETFFKIYDKQRQAEGTQVIHIDSHRDIGLIGDQMLVLREDPAHNAFQDITAFLRNLKVERLTGCYQDGWMDEEAGVIVMAGSTGEITMEIMYPGNLIGGEVLTIEYGNDGHEVLHLTENVSYYSIRTEPYTLVPLTFHANFYMPDAQEQRGEKRLAFLLNMTAD